MTGVDGEGGERFAYFMIRIHGRQGEAPGDPSGIIERLGSGRKQPFSGAEELIRLLTEEPNVAPKMRDGVERGNE